MPAQWKPKHNAPPDWPTLADYEASRRGSQDACPPHDWRPANPKKPDGRHVCGICEATIEPGQPGSHLPWPSTFRPMADG